MAVTNYILKDMNDNGRYVAKSPVLVDVLRKQWELEAEGQYTQLVEKKSGRGANRYEGMVSIEAMKKAKAALAAEGIYPVGSKENPIKLGRVVEDEAGALEWHPAEESEDEEAVRAAIARETDLIHSQPGCPFSLDDAVSDQCGGCGAVTDLDELARNGGQCDGCEAAGAERRAAEAAAAAEEAEAEAGRTVWVEEAGSGGTWEVWVGEKGRFGTSVAVVWLQDDGFRVVMNADGKAAAPFADLDEVEDWVRAELAVAPPDETALQLAHEIELAEAAQDAAAEALLRSEIALGMAYYEAKLHEGLDRSDAYVAAFDAMEKRAVEHRRAYGKSHAPTRFRERMAEVWADEDKREEA